MEISGCFFMPKEVVLKDKYQRLRGVTKVLGLSKNARVRLEWMIFYETKALKNVLLTCRHFGISPKTFYKWLKRFDETNLRLLADRSRAPKNKRKPEYTEEEVQRVIELRLKYPTLGRDKIHRVYQEEYGLNIAYWSVRKVIHDFKLYAQIATKANGQSFRAKGLIKKRITDLRKRSFSGFLLELDTIVIYFASQKRYILTAIDYHSRFGFAFYV